MIGSVGAAPSASGQSSWWSRQFLPPWGRCLRMSDGLAARCRPHAEAQPWSHGFKAQACQRPRSGPPVTASVRTVRLIPFALLVAVTACNPASQEWVKSGASAEDLRLAREECHRQSSSYDFALDDNLTGQPGVIDDAPDRQLRAGSAQ